MTLDYETHKDDIQLSYSDGMYSALQNIPFYKHVKPTMLPFIGTDYDDSTNKVLLVCKSFAVPRVKTQGVQLNEDPDIWYRAKKEEMEKFFRLDDPEVENNDEDKFKVHGWLEAIYHLTNENKGWVWWKLVNAILGIKDKPFQDSPQDKYEQKKRNSVYKHLALMNYFTRPATGNAKNLNIRKKDRQESYKAFKKTVEALDPQFIFIFGKDAGNAFEGSKKKDKEFIAYLNDKNICYKNPYSPSHRGYWAQPDGKQLFLQTLPQDWM